MAVKKKGLGKGLDSLIPDNRPAESRTGKRTGERRSKDRRTDDEHQYGRGPTGSSPVRSSRRTPSWSCRILSKQFGVIQPILVRKRKEYYEIIAGERRWRAAKMAGVKEVPVIVKEYTEQEIVEISLIENIQRENLNPIEEAMAYKKLLEGFHLKQDEVAERVSKSRTAVTNSMRLLKLDEKVQQMIVDDMISTGHARALLAIDDHEQQYETGGQSLR